MSFHININPSINIYLEQSTPLLLFLPWMNFLLPWHPSLTSFRYRHPSVTSFSIILLLQASFRYILLYHPSITGILPLHSSAASSHYRPPSVSSFCSILPWYPYPSTPSYFILFSHLIQRVLNLPFSPTRILIISIYTCSILYPSHLFYFPISSNLLQQNKFAKQDYTQPTITTHGNNNTNKNIKDILSLHNIHKLD